MKWIFNYPPKIKISKKTDITFSTVFMVYDIEYFFDVHILEKTAIVMVYSKEKHNLFKNKKHLDRLLINISRSIKMFSNLYVVKDIWFISEDKKLETLFNKLMQNKEFYEKF